MVLEATVICMDNSEWMRNGDYPPSRFQAQADAVNLICGAKTQSNPENTVGVLTMAGKGRVLVTPTADLGKILSSLHGLEVSGETNLVAGVQKAQLALKHRQNKNQRQRIVLFSGSPVTTDEDTLIRIGKKLKKNNVALDIVSFGDEDETKSSKLESFLAAVNSNDNSHLVHIPSGPSVLSDVLISSPIFTGDGEGSGFAAAAAAGAAAAAAGGGAGGDFDFGVDANLDPELALALRVSLEEERARQEAATKKAAEDSSAVNNANVDGNGGKDVGDGGGNDGGLAVSAREEKKGADPSTMAVDHTLSDSNVENSTVAVSRSAFEDLQPMDDESALLEQAIAMSMADASASSSNASQHLHSTFKDSAMTDTSATDELAAALQLSMNESNSSPSATDANFTSMFSDQTFVNSILSSLPGVDPNDPSIRSAIEELQHSAEKKESEKKEEDKK